MNPREDRAMQWLAQSAGAYAKIRSTRIVHKEVCFVESIGKRARIFYDFSG